MIGRLIQRIFILSTFFSYFSTKKKLQQKTESKNIGKKTFFVVFIKEVNYWNFLPDDGDK